jgi:hypothetical protein
MHTPGPSLESPIQNLTAFDILGERHDGGIDAAIVAATPIDGSADTLAALAKKVRNYAAELSSPAFLAKYPGAAGKLRIILYAHGPVDSAAEGLIQSLALEVRSRGISLETEHVTPNTSFERTREG